MDGDQKTYQCELCATYVPYICKSVHDQKCLIKNQPKFLTLPSNNNKVQSQDGQSNNHNNNNNNVDSKISIQKNQGDFVNQNNNKPQQNLDQNIISSFNVLIQNQCQQPNGTIQQVSNFVQGRFTNPNQPNNKNQDKDQQKIFLNNSKKQQPPVQDSNTQQQFPQFTIMNKQQNPQKAQLFIKNSQSQINFNEHSNNRGIMTNQQISKKMDAQ